MGPGERRAAGFLFVVFAAMLVLSAVPLQPSAAPAPVRARAITATGVLLVTFDIQVDTAAADYVQRAVTVALDNSYDLAIIMNTPGGLLDSMSAIVDSIGRLQSAGLKAFTFVPMNDFAASAGSYIALACDAVYMANGSFIGPSTPIVVGGTPDEQAHVTNAMLALMQSFAQKNGYNYTAASNMVLYNQAYSAQDAASIGLITGLADNLNDVLAAQGVTSLPVYRYDEPIYDQFLSFLSNPLVDGLFILVGVVALVLDIFHRTLFLTVVAVVMIALGFLGAQVIGAPLTAILVLIVAAALIFIEVKAGHGLFATSGILLGLAGTYLLIYGVGWSPSPFGLGQYVVMGVVAGLLVLGFVYLSRIRKSLLGQPKLVDPTRVVNRTGRAATDIRPGQDGVANVDSEDWTAVSDEPIEKGTPIRVKAYEDGKVRVEKLPPPGAAGDAPRAA